MVTGTCRHAVGPQEDDSRKWDFTFPDTAFIRWGPSIAERRDSGTEVYGALEMIKCAAMVRVFIGCTMHTLPASHPAARATLMQDMVCSEYVPFMGDEQRINYKRRISSACALRPAPTEYGAVSPEVSVGQ